jgi:hypothetical protein
MSMTTQIRALGNHVSRVHRAIDADKPLTAKRFTRDFARFIRDNSYSDLAIWTRHGLDRYAFPGGYPLYYIDGEGQALCPDCATKSLGDYTCPSFRPVAADINYEDPALHCDDCSQRIESAYAD